MDGAHFNLQIQKNINELNPWFSNNSLFKLKLANLKDGWGIKLLSNMRVKFGLIKVRRGVAKLNLGSLAVNGQVRNEHKLTNQLRPSLRLKS